MPNKFKFGPLIIIIFILQIYRNELGNINTYDTIPEINNKNREEINTILKNNTFLDELNDPSGVNNNIEAQMDKNQEK